MAKLSCNFPSSLDTLDTDRQAGQDITSDSYDIIETAITQLEIYAVDLNDKERYAMSPQIVTGGVLSAGTNAGTFKVTALTALLRTTHSLIGELKYISLAEQDNQAMGAANTTYFVMLDYNGGTPQIVTSETNSYAGGTDYTQIPLGKVMKDGSDNVHFISAGFAFQDGVRKLHMKQKEKHYLELVSGGALSYSGTNNFTMEAAVYYAGANRITRVQYISSDTNFTPIYSDGGAGWTEGAPRATIDYEKYDDGDGTLGNVGVSKYGCHWVYVHSGDGHVYVVYGVDSYSLAAAEVAPVPDVPDHLTDFGVLIGCIIAPQAGGSFTTIQMVTDTVFTRTSPSDHNDLANLDGGTADEYYHLTSAQHTIAIQAATTDLSGYLATADWDTFNNKAEADQTMYIGTTQVAINRGSAALTLAGLTLTTPDIGTPSAGIVTNLSGAFTSVTSMLNAALYVGRDADNQIKFASDNIIQFRTSGADGILIGSTGEMDFNANSAGFTLQTATGDGTTTIDWKLGNHFKFTLGAQSDTFTFTAPTNPCHLFLLVKQDGTGGRDLTFPASVKWLQTEPTWTDGGADKHILIGLLYDGTDYFAGASDWQA